MPPLPSLSPKAKVSNAHGVTPLAGLFLILVVVLLAGVATGQDCPAPTPSITSSTPPTDVGSFPNNCNPITDFDDFSWRMFVAMIWPAANGQRGMPDTTQSNFPVTGPLVFETYKADWETFTVPPNAPTQPPPPSAWVDFAGTKNPCTINGQTVTAGWGDVVLSSYTKFGNLGLAGFGPFLTGPVIAQNQTYVRYLASYNQTEYNQILNAGWFLQKNLGNLTFCSNGATVNGNACPAENSIDLKSSWMDMTGVDSSLLSRYFTTKAWVLDPATNTCSQKTMGLVGLHIVTKTPSRPQWIWSTFEQVDNVPPVGSSPPYSQKFNFNDGKVPPPASEAPPSADPYCVTGQTGCPGNPPPPAQMPASAPAPFNVARLMPIGVDAGSTPATNAAYQKLMASTAPNSPWQYYQLIMTQWPLNASQPSQFGCPKNTFPGLNPTSSTSNVTLETFDQLPATVNPSAPGCSSSQPTPQAQVGCMNCHNATAHPKAAANGNDFLWSLAANAWAGPTTSANGALLAKSPLPASTLAAFDALRGLQQGALATNKSAAATAAKAAAAKSNKKDKKKQ